MEENLQTKIARIDERVNEMHRVLLGNGQPGKIEQMEEDIRALQQAHVTTRATVRGAKWMAALIFTVGHAAIMLYLHLTRK